MTELRFMRAFEDDRVNIIPADKETAHAILELPMHQVFTLTLKAGTRTSQQNRAMHKYFTMLADALNEAGQYMNTFPWKEGAEVSWDAESVKSKLWRPLQEAVTGKDSTTKLDTSEVDTVYQYLSRHLAEKCGVSVEFPQREFE